MSVGAADSRQSLRSKFKAPEGLYHLHSEKITGLVPFQAHRGTRLTVAELYGGAEEGVYIVFNVGDMLHICRSDSSDKEPIKSLMVSNSSSRLPAFPTCHAHSTSARDGADLIVGLVSGEILLLSLRAQLQLGAGTKPVVTNTFNAEGVQDTSRCNALTFLPRSDGTQFVAAYASGSLYVYKKSLHHKKNSSISVEGGVSLVTSKFSLSNPLSSKAQSHLISTYNIGGGGLSDIAFSPDGNFLAVACRDGILRLLDANSGTLVSGFQAYYGALLCCGFSADGRYVAAGGEDDLVTVFGVAEKAVVAFGEGHTSWVSRVAFDPWTSTAAAAAAAAAAAIPSTSGGPPSPVPALGGGGSGSSGNGTPGGRAGGGSVAAVAAAVAPPEKIYRIASVGQDCALCLWDLALEDEEAPPAFGFQPYAMKRVASTSHVGIPNSTSSAPVHTRSASAVSSSSPNGELHPPGAAVAHAPPPRQSSSSSMLAAALRGGSSSSSSVAVAAAAAAAAAAASGATSPASGTITPSISRSDMSIIPPIVQHRIHSEPLSDLLFVEGGMYTACYSGQVKFWQRPQPDT